MLGFAFGAPPSVEYSISCSAPARDGDILRWLVRKNEIFSYTLASNGMVCVYLPFMLNIPVNSRKAEMVSNLIIRSWLQFPAALCPVKPDIERQLCYSVVGEVHYGLVGKMFRFALPAHPEEK